MTAGFWNLLASHLEEGNPAFLVLVAENTEGSPGTAGAKMFVRADGGQVGTIGGGIMEFNLLDRAREALAGGSFSPEALTLWHRKTGPGSKSGMICAGNQTNVCLLCHPESHLNVIRQIAQLADRGSGGTLCITPAGITCEESPVDLSVPMVKLFREPDGNWRYEEQMINGKRIAIIGGGHCGRALSRVMHQLGYHVMAFDKRPDVETFVGNEWADVKEVVADYADAGERVNHPVHTCVVVMTTDYPSDVRALEGTLNLPFPFIGIMGSVAKINQIKADLRKAGFDAARLESMHAPVGMPIHSHTPEEIAISIAAEIIKHVFEANPRRPGPAPGVLD